MAFDDSGIRKATQQTLFSNKSSKERQASKSARSMQVNSSSYLARALGDIIEGVPEISATAHQQKMEKYLSLSLFLSQSLSDQKKSNNSKDYLI